MNNQYLVPATLILNYLFENLSIGKNIKASDMVGCIKIIMASRSSKVILSLYFIFVRPHLEHCFQVWGPGQWPVGVSPEEAIKMIRGIEHIFCVERLRELELFSLKRRLQDDLITSSMTWRKPIRKMGRVYLQKHVVIEQGAMTLNWE